MVQTKVLRRIFDISNKNINLPDPNPELSVEQVRDLYSNTYPELVNCTISGPKLSADEARYSFSTVVGTKG